MKKNEYIGRRYVPKVIGNWKNNIAYESLSIVLWKGSSYTSVQDVPIGIDINNESYWVLSGNYNAQVEIYRQEVKAFDKKIKDLECTRQEVIKARKGLPQLVDKITDLENIVDHEIPQSFTKGSSFLCVDDNNITNYLLNDPKTLQTFKRCDIQVVLLTMTFAFDGTNVTGNSSVDKIREASEYLVNNGIRVGLKIQDKGIEVVNSSNYLVWFEKKTALMLDYLNVVPNPVSINIANEIPKMTNDAQYIPNFNLMYSTLKTAYPLMLITVHTFFSDFYNGLFKMYSAVDQIGINYYPYVTDNPVPTYKEVKRAIYKPINGVAFFDTLNEVYKTKGKKFFISEWGTAGFNYQCKNPSTDFIPSSEKVLNPIVQAIFMDSACQLFPFIENCTGLYLWSANCWRPQNTPIQRAWAWDLNDTTINYIEKTWGGVYNE